MFDAFFNDLAGQAALAVLLVSVLDFISGVAAAFRDNVFKWSVVDAWVRSTLVGRIFGITGLLLVGYLAKDIQFVGLPVIESIGLGAATVYVTATIAGIGTLWGPNAVKQGVPIG